MLWWRNLSNSLSKPGKGEIMVKVTITYMSQEMETVTCGYMSVEGGAVVLVDKTDWEVKARYIPLHLVAEVNTASKKKEK